MTRSIVEEGRLCVQCSSRKRRTQLAQERRSPNTATTGQAKYGNNRVQEIVSGTTSA